jgi:hypothetical protein
LRILPHVRLVLQRVQEARVKENISDQLLLASRVTRHTSHVTRHTSRVTRHTSHVTRHTSHVTRHTSHVTRRVQPHKLGFQNTNHNTISVQYLAPPLVCTESTAPRGSPRFARHLRQSARAL